MSQPYCAHCNEPVALNPKKVDMPPHFGWGHADSMRRDHQATPHDDRTAEFEIARMTSRMDQARAHVNETLGWQFRELEMGEQ